MVQYSVLGAVHQCLDPIVSPNKQRLEASFSYLWTMPMANTVLDTFVVA